MEPQERDIAYPNPYSGPQDPNTTKCLIYLRTLEQLEKLILGWKRVVNTSSKSSIHPCLGAICIDTQFLKGRKLFAVRANIREVFGYPKRTFEMETKEGIMVTSNEFETKANKYYKELREHTSPIPATFQKRNPDFSIRSLLYPDLRYYDYSHILGEIAEHKIKILPAVDNSSMDEIVPEENIDKLNVLLNLNSNPLQVPEWQENGHAVTIKDHCDRQRAEGVWNDERFTKKRQVKVEGEEMDPSTRKKINKEGVGIEGFDSNGKGGNENKKNTTELKVCWFDPIMTSKLQHKIQQKCEEWKKDTLHLLNFEAELLQTTFKAKQSRIDELEKYIELVHQSEESMKRKLKEKQENLEKESKMRKMLEEKIKELEGEKSMWEERRRDAVEEEAIMQELEAVRREKSVQAIEFATKEMEYKDQLLQAQNQVKGFKTQLENAEEKVRKEGAINQAFQGQMKEIQTKMMELEAINKDKQQSSSLEKAEIVRLRNELQEKIGLVEKMKKEYENRIQEREEELKNSKVKLETAEKKISEFEQDDSILINLSLQVKVQAYEKRINELEEMNKELSQSKAVVGRPNKRLEDLKKQVTQKDKELGDLKRQLEKAEGRVREEESINRELQAQVRENQRKIQELEASIKALKEPNDELVRQKKEWKGVIKEKDDGIANMTKELRGKRTRNQKLQELNPNNLIDIPKGKVVSASKENIFYKATKRTKTRKNSKKKIVSSDSEE